MNSSKLWQLTLIIITLIVGFTLIYLQHHSWIIRFEMDNNTLEAVKSIDWDAIKSERVDLGYNLETNESLWKYPNETQWRVRQ